MNVNATGPTVIHQPFPVPSEALQYRAIGLVKGRYIPEPERITKGIIQTEDGTLIDAVLLGRVLSLVRKHLDLTQEHLWVVYPRTREIGEMHAQIVGVWSPGGQLKQTLSEVTVIPPGLDSFFAIRGEVVFQEEQENYFLIKIKQQKRKKKPGKAFKVRLEGVLPESARNQFWDFEARRIGNKLEMQGNHFVAPLRKPVGRGKPGRPSSSNNANRPILRGGGSRNPLPRPTRREAT